MSRPKTLLAALVLAATLPLASCSGFPTAPHGLPADWVPSATPSPLDSNRVDSPLGFSLQERAAVRVRPSTCEHLVKGSGFILDDHTIVTSRGLLTGYVSVALALADGTDLTVASIQTSASGSLEFITTVESLAPWAPLADEDPAVGDNVEVFGYMADSQVWGAGATVEESTAVPGDAAFVTFGMPYTVFYGANGGGAYNDNGLLVGIFSEADADHPAASLIPVSTLRAMRDDPSLLEDHPAATC